MKNKAAKTKTSLFKRIGNYTERNHQWVIATLLAIITLLATVLVVPWGIQLADNAEATREKATLKATATFYFMPRTNNVDADAIKDGADCWGSSASQRSDAYRCALGNLLHDPCFYQATWNYVDCPSEPGKHTIITVAKLDKNPSIQQDTGKQTPWYIVLNNGTRCRYYTGVTDTIADGRIDYGCEDGTWLSLPVDASKEILTIKCYKQKLERIEICKMKEAWY